MNADMNVSPNLFSFSGSQPESASLLISSLSAYLTTGLVF